MAIAFDAVGQNHDSGTVASLQINITVGSGSNRKLWVGFIMNKAVIPSISSVALLTGEVLTATADTPQNPPGDTTVKAYLYYLDNPPSGAISVVITPSSSVDGIAGLAFSYSGAAAGIDSHAKITGTGTSATLTTTTVADNAWIVGVFRNNAAGNGSAGTGTTQRGNVTGQVSVDDSNGGKSPPGSYSIQETWSGSAPYVGVGASMAPAIPPTSGFFAAASR